MLLADSRNKLEKGALMVMEWAQLVRMGINYTKCQFVAPKQEPLLLFGAPPHPPLTASTVTGIQTTGCGCIAEWAAEQTKPDATQMLPGGNKSRGMLA